MKKIHITDNVYIFKLTSIDYNQPKLIDELMFNLDISKELSPQNSKYPGIQSDIVILGGELSYVRNQIIDIFDNFIYESKNTYSYKNWIYLSSKKNPYTHYHEHTNMVGLKTKGEWTWTLYIQMPDNLKGNDGELMFLANGVEKSLLPEEGDLFIFPAELNHMPNTNQSSTKDRIVLAGTMSKMDLSKKYTKTNNTLL
jgi:hypothetical protein